MHSHICSSNAWLQIKSWQVPRERSHLFHSVVSKPSYIVEHGHHFFHTCTRNSSPLVTSLEQKHHPSFASALVSQDVGPYFTGGWITTLVHTAPGPCVYISAGPVINHHGSPKSSKFPIFQSLGLFVTMKSWRSRFPSLHFSSVTKPEIPSTDASQIGRQPTTQTLGHIEYL